MAIKRMPARWPRVPIPEDRPHVNDGGKHQRRHELARAMFPIVDGGMAAPAAPGLGVGIDGDFVERFTARG